MKCQLGRLTKDKDQDMELEEEWEGKLVWVKMEPPRYKTLTTPEGKKLPFLNVVTMAYTENGMPCGLPAFFVELLPYFTDIEPYPAYEWKAKGGEKIG